MTTTPPPGPPAKDFIRYDLLTQNALRGVVRDVLGLIAREGVPGEHHFYVAFRTTDADVRMSNRLRERYPAEMTIVLQHQFWDLEVDEEGFRVGLSFGNVPEKLAVPFRSITGFFDPSVQFGLKFDHPDGESLAEDAPANVSPAAEISTFTIPEPADEARDVVEPPPAAGGAEVVSLDKFRKK